MPGEREFGLEEGGLPGPKEISDEERRTGQRRGPYRRRYLATEDIPNWFDDTGVERDGDEDDREESGETFPDEDHHAWHDHLPNGKEDEEFVSFFKSPVTEEMLIRAAEERDPREKLETAAPQKLAEQPKREPLRADSYGRDAGRLRRRHESHGKRGKKQELPKSSRVRKQASRTENESIRKLERDMER